MPAVRISPKPANKMVLEPAASLAVPVVTVGVRVWAVMAGVGGAAVGTMVLAAAGTVFVATASRVDRPLVGLGAGVLVEVAVAVAEAVGEAASVPVGVALGVDSAQPYRPDWGWGSTTARG